MTSQRHNNNPLLLFDCSFSDKYYTYYLFLTAQASLKEYSHADSNQVGKSGAWKQHRHQQQQQQWGHQEPSYLLLWFLLTCSRDAPERDRRAVRSQRTPLLPSSAIWSPLAPVSLLLPQPAPPVPPRLSSWWPLGWRQTHAALLQ